MIPTIQELIYKLEVGEGFKWVRAGSFALLLMGVAVLYDFREFRNLSRPEAMDAAQIARNLARGEGFTTHFIRPFSLHLLDQRRRALGNPDPSGKTFPLPHPDLANPPVYPALLAAFMKVVPFDYETPEGRVFRIYRPDLLIALMNQGLFLVLLLLTYNLGARLFDPLVGRLSVIALAGSEVLWRLTASGLPTVLLMVWVAAALLALVLLDAGAQPQPRSARWLLAGSAGIGVLLGLACLTTYAAGWLVLAVAAYFLVAFPGRRAVMTAGLVAAFLLVVSPWLARNHGLSGSWFGTAATAVLQETQTYPGGVLERSLEPEVTLQVLRQVGRKAALNLAQILQNELPRTGGVVAALFLVSLFIPFVNPVRSRIRWWTVGTLFLLTAAQAVSRTHLSESDPVVSSENLLLVLLPVAVVFGSAMFCFLLDQVTWTIEGGRLLGLGLFGAVALAPVGIALLPPRPDPRMHPPYFPPLIQQFAGWMTKDEVVMSDIPWAVAWYGDRPCLWLTLYAQSRTGREDFFAVNDFRKTINTLYLTTVTMDEKFFSGVFQGQALAQLAALQTAAQGTSRVDGRETAKGRDIGWAEFAFDSLVRTNLPTGFPLKSAHGPYALRGHLVLSDRVRWRRLPGADEAVRAQGAPR